MGQHVDHIRLEELPQHCAEHLEGKEGSWGWQGEGCSEAGIGTSSGDGAAMGQATRPLLTLWKCSGQLGGYSGRPGGSSTLCPPRAERRQEREAPPVRTALSPSTEGAAVSETRTPRPHWRGRDGTAHSQPPTAHRSTHLDTSLRQGRKSQVPSSGSQGREGSLPTHAGQR